MAKDLASLSILIPTYNDQDTIETEIEEAAVIGRRVSEKLEILVINDASTDKGDIILKRLTRKIRELKITTHIKNRGYGQTIKELYTSAKCEWIFTTPGDYQIPPTEIMKLIPFTAQADMIIGWRVNRHDPPARLRQSLIYNILLKMLYGLDLHDINSVRLMRSKIIKNIRLTTTSAFVDAELVIDAKRAGYRVIEKPIGHRARGQEAGAGGGKLKTILPVVKEMILYRIRGT
ncbi:hypothetical protein A2154_00010 [Candidatus Gottesmanbacteria bacterium RBG_16_43_7]|uniref:Glycosyltransferase 2-like domain-containing protein n=1 Tax=Candidatus Gottesmanbacteria bacterium RBG_16_43_7 TaxID=1798373 RepID=A0A1F5ZBQ0_9BACT|nr:MAG: hypothetical protein A2154_00010 [Candidatus Gottesmanbacteria bacterium RBG_16_43_7]